MKKLGILAVLMCFLVGCSGKGEEIDRAMELRSRLLKAEECSFDARITADYGDKLYEFSMTCQSDDRGDLGFTVTEPETIAGITGHISTDKGKLTFDGLALYFDLLADGQLSPVSAPWVFIKTLRSGYLTAAGVEGDSLRLTIDDSYEENALQLDIWLDGENTPTRAEVLYDGRRILTILVSNFQIL